MTSLPEPVGVDTDLIDTGRRPWRAVLAALLIGLVVGGLLGALAGSSGTKSYQATTALSVLPDPTLSTDPGTQNSVSQDSTAFIQSELVVLNGSQLADEVRNDLKLNGSPDIVSTQLGQSYVVQVTATAGSAGRARRVATVAARDYAGLRSRQLGAEVQNLQSSLTRQVNAVRAQLTASRKGKSPTASETPAEIALQTQLEQLLADQTQLSNTQISAASVVRVLTPARTDSTALSSTTKDALIGALIGALIALVLLALARRSAPRVNGVSDLAALGAPVVLPALPSPSLRAVRAHQTWRTPSARLLAARLMDDVVAADSLLVVAGCDATSGQGVASALAANLVDRRPVLLVSNAVAGLQQPRVAEQAPPAPAADATTDGADSTIDDLIEDTETSRPDRSIDPLALDDDWSTVELDSHSLQPYDGGRHSDNSPPADGAHAAVDHTPVVDRDVPRVAATSAPGVWVTAEPAAEPATESGAPGVDARKRALIGLLHDAVSAGWLVVLDAPPLTESGLAVDCIVERGTLVIGTGRGRTRPAAVVASLDLCEARNVPVAGVVLTDNGGLVQRILRRRDRASSLPTLSSEPSVALSSPPWRAAAAAPARLPQHRPRPGSNGRRAAHFTRSGR